MKRVFAYLMGIAIVLLVLGYMLLMDKFTLPGSDLKLAMFCGICGGYGGITYCLRGIYLNACVLKQWDESWLPWYFIRPVVSFICGVVSWVFLKAGLIALEAEQVDSSSNLAFFALAFVAGLNVDRFIEKVEDIAQVTWGIKKSRAARKDAENG